MYKSKILEHIEDYAIKKSMNVQYSFIIIYKF